VLGSGICKKSLLVIKFLQEYMCVCVCERERERERESVCGMGGQGAINVNKESAVVIRKYAISDTYFCHL